MKFGSLFSGIGGIDLGLERAGMECRWQVEIDDQCQRVLAKHWPDVAKYRDIRGVDFERVERVDLIAGGHPCQPDSLAGKRRGATDERWLWPEFARAIRQVRPRYVLVENPTGIFSGGMPIVLGDLAALGYDAEWRVLSAAQFGAPHLRERVFIVAYSHGLRWPSREVFPGLTARSTPAKPSCALPTGQWRGVHRQSTSGRVRLVPDTGVFGVAHGLPNGVDRLRGLGNAVVPQVAEFAGRCIMEADRIACGE